MTRCSTATDAPIARKLTSADIEFVTLREHIDARLAAIGDSERIPLEHLTDDVALPALLDDVGREDRLRALALLDLPFGSTVAYAAPDSGFDRQLVLHLRTRPVAEETLALNVRDIVERAILHVHPDPLQDGSWNGREIVLDEDMKPGEGTQDMAPRSGQMTREQVRKLYGWDDATIEKQLKDGRLEEKAVAGQTVYELPDVSMDKFTQVLLHEVGHSVDSILGTKTEVVYDMAGWRQYDEGDFETWATEMGGWDKVEKSDQAKIRQAWLDALRSKLSVSSMVDHEHPARAKKYEGVGIVDATRADINGLYTNPIRSNGRTFVMQPYYGYFYSLKAEAAGTAPSAYSLYAPAEYFAECYVEYYRSVDGTPAGAQLKGGMLPSPVKKWFDAHVDKVRFDPKRLEKPQAEP